MKIGNKFKGLGISNFNVQAVMSIYYIYLLAYSNTYLLLSFTNIRPWDPNSSENLLIQTKSFFENKVLNQVSKYASYEELTTIYWPLLAIFLISWVIIYYLIKGGTDTTGKIAVYTVSLPYILLTVLLIRVLMLEGCEIGFKYLLIPDF
jgi:SNF family Na+-dependent transporter